MTMNRESLLGKIRALLSKTIDAGCTEEEALAALAKAQAMMDAYEVTEADLALTKEEKAVLRAEPAGTRDPHGIKSSLATAVAKFAECRVWRSQGGLTFCGLESDARMATWLLDTLTGFVLAELTRHLVGSIAPRGDRRLIISSFAMGCCSRISERLNALRDQSTAAATGNRQALVVVKGQAIADLMARQGIKLRGGGTRGRRVDRDAFAAGKAAGDRASFGRPITGAGAVRLLR